MDGLQYNILFMFFFLACMHTLRRWFVHGVSRTTEARASLIAPQGGIMCKVDVIYENNEKKW